MPDIPFLSCCVLTKRSRAGLDGMVEIAKCKLEKHDRLTCMFLPTLHLYINFSSSCKDLCYSPQPPPLTCNPPKKGGHFVFDTLYERNTHQTRPCCHPLSDGWSSGEGDGRELCSSFGFEEVLCFRAQLPRRSRCWQLSGKSGEIFCVFKRPSGDFVEHTSSRVVSESP